jgi:AcrR family transcriptional regulator
VVDAAGAVFAERGYMATTMQAIARVAGVSVDTVYLLGPKRELLFAALEKALVGDEGSHSALERPWVKEMLAEPDARRLLTLLAKATGGGHSRTAGIFHALVGGAEADEEVAQAYRELVARMRSDTAAIAALLDERRGRTHRGLALEDLGDTFWVITHVEGYRHLVEEAGWDLEHYVTWLEQILTRLVLGSAAGEGPADGTGR